VAADWLQPAALNRCLATDGPLGGEWFNITTVATLDAQVWGQGFEAPVFCDEVDVLQQRLVARNAKLRVRLPARCAAIWFGVDPLPDRVRLARLSLDHWNGRRGCRWSSRRCNEHDPAQA
jgi:single-stranded-DNA-specific exonuclease